eukprot:3299467-Lingulodinium_polyedra.AAC.1
MPGTHRLHGKKNWPDGAGCNGPASSSPSSSSGCKEQPPSRIQAGSTSLTGSCNEDNPISVPMSVQRHRTSLR